MKIIEREISQAQVDALVQNGVAPLLARLFVGRGVQSPQELDTGLQHLLPPSGLKGIEAAAQLLAHVRAGGQATLTLCGEAQALHFKRARSALIQRFQSFFKPKTFNSLRNQL